MLSILKHNENVAAKIMGDFDVDYEAYKSELEYVKHESDSSYTEFYDETPSDSDSPMDDDSDPFSGRSSGGSSPKGNSKSRTPVLDNFGRDVTRLAEEGKLDPIIGRETEIERVSQILSRRIGASTLDEYRQHIEKDGALDRRFQKVIVEPPSNEEAVHILHNIKEKYEDFHNVTYSDEAIEACVSLSTRYISDRFLPDKAIDVMDEVGARTHLKNIHVPEHIEELEAQIEVVKESKNQSVKNQQYEEAAELRDQETKLQKKLEEAKIQWDEDSKTRKYPVEEKDIAEVLSDHSYS